MKIGDTVRSFDFDGRELEGSGACYVEGKLVGIDSTHFDCPRYVIHVKKRIFDGKRIEGDGNEFVYPPVNGTPTWLGGVCDGVVLVLEGG